MAKQQRRLLLLDTTFSKPVISWVKCILCQTDNKQSLIAPTESGYNSLSEHLIECAEYEPLAAHIQLENLHQTLIDNNAKYHKNCRTQYNSQKIERLKKNPRLDDKL